MGTPDPKFMPVSEDNRVCKRLAGQDLEYIDALESANKQLSEERTRIKATLRDRSKPTQRRINEALLIIEEEKRWVMN